MRESQVAETSKDTLLQSITQILLWSNTARLIETKVTSEVTRYDSALNTTLHCKNMHRSKRVQPAREVLGLTLMPTQPEVAGTTP